jgi:hypothetical protein
MDYFADNGKVFTTDEVVSTMARRSFVTFESLGIIGSIMPWNFPYWQAKICSSFVDGWEYNSTFWPGLKGFLHVSFTIFLGLSMCMTS